MNDIFNGFSPHTLITDILAISGFFALWFGPLVFAWAQKKMLKSRLFTTIDGQKLFEKLKYDLRIDGKLHGINREQLFKSQSYALTIFSRAMEYNKRDMIWYFNEKYARETIYQSISKKVWLNIFVWFLFLAIGIFACGNDFFKFFLNGSVTSDNALAAMGVLFTTALCFTAILKYFEWFSVKNTINDKVRQINLVKKELVWNDYKIIYWIQIGFLALSVLLIIINQFFN